MFGIGFLELVVIGVVALLFVGPERLPEFMRKAGRFFAHARRISDEVRSTFNTAIHEVDDEIRREKAEALRKILEEHRTKESAVKLVAPSSEAAGSETPASETTVIEAPSLPIVESPVEREDAHNGQARAADFADGSTFAHDAAVSDKSVSQPVKTS